MIFLVLLMMLTPAEKRGRELYFRGGSGTAIVAGAAEVPSSSLPCVNCHGPDRRGVREGTVVPPDIRWPVLSAPDVNRPRLRYDDASLRRVITDGVNSRGDALSPVMPRYRLTPDALSDLIAYLRRDAPDPGLTDTTITIATTPLLRPIVAAYVSELRIHGRSFELTPDASSAFALIGLPAADPLDRVPILTPFAIDYPTAFALYADLSTQALALSRSTDSPRNVFIEHDNSPPALAALAALSPRNTFPRSDDDVLYLLGDVDVPQMLARLEREQWRPRILAAGTRHPLPPGRRILRAASTHPADLTPATHAEVAAFAAHHSLPRSATLFATYATVQVLAEALKRAGRGLTRESLIASLEQFYDFPTGLTPPLTFSRTRRIGAAGAWVVEVDGGKARYVSAW